MKPFKMAQPTTVKGAISVLGETPNETPVLAGGTDLLGEIKEGVRSPSMVVNIKSIPGMRQVKATARQIEIGALVTLSDLMENADIRKALPALVETIRKTAATQIRNNATVGGNLCQRPRCWYYRDSSFNCLKKGGELCYAREGEHEYHAIFDNATCNMVHPSNLAPVFIAHDASFEVTGPDGTESIPAAEFFISPEEEITAETILMPQQVLTRVIIPAKGLGGRASYIETREKQSFDWALAGATVRLERDAGKVTAARVVLSAVAPTPLRRGDLEAMLVGKSVSEKLIGKVCEAAAKEATPLEQNGFKTSLVKAVLRRALRAVTKG